MTARRTAAARAVEFPGGALEVAGISDRGPAREQNQDVWVARPAPGGCLLALADGMGGAPGGLQAARAAVEGAVEEPGVAVDPGDDLVGRVAAAGLAVARVRAAMGGSPGTTLVLAAIRGRGATVANVGDSRAYLIRGGAAIAITRDHSWAAEQVAAGRMTAAEARRDGRRNLITRAILGDEVRPDLFPLELAAGDLLLLCTDGAWERLPDPDLARLLSGGEPLERLLEAACDAALAAGSTDNVTLLAARAARP